MMSKNKSAVTIRKWIITALFMELRGIEPLSESLFIAASPITVISLTFPPLYAK